MSETTCRELENWMQGFERQYLKEVEGGNKAKADDAMSNLKADIQWLVKCLKKPLSESAESSQLNEKSKLSDPEKEEAKEVRAIQEFFQKLPAPVENETVQATTVNICIILSEVYFIGRLEGHNRGDLKNAYDNVKKCAQELEKALDNIGIVNEPLNWLLPQAMGTRRLNISDVLNAIEETCDALLLERQNAIQRQRTPIKTQLVLFSRKLYVELLDAWIAAGKSRFNENNEPHQELVYVVWIFVNRVIKFQDQLDNDSLRYKPISIGDIKAEVAKIVLPLEPDVAP